MTFLFFHFKQHKFNYKFNERRDIGIAVQSLNDNTTYKIQHE